ncbi:MAG: hypothetical protein V3V40_06270 [Nitrosomonadaceae bacterium]
MVGLNTNTSDRIPARQAVDTSSVFQITDFENVAFPTITLEEKVYSLHNVISAGATAYQFIFPQGATTSIVASNRFKNLLVSLIAIDAFFETAANSANLSLNFDNLAAIYLGTPSGSVLFDLNFLAPAAAAQLQGFSTLESQRGIFRGFESLGSLTNAQIISIKDGFFENYVNGITLDAVADTAIVACEFVSAGSGSGPTIELKGTISAFTLMDCGFTLGSSESVIRIDPGIPDDAKVTVAGMFIRGIGSPSLFDTAGIDGTFASVSDATISATAITSVVSGTLVNGANAARFNANATALSVGQIVTTTAFASEVIYNVTAKITVVTGTFFELENVVFTASDTGSFSADVVTINSTSHGLNDGDTLLVDTTLGTDYDGGATVFASVANSFEISRAFTVTKAGTWTTRGLDQRDSRVIAINNPGFLRSKYLGGAFVNGAGTLTTIATIDTYTDIEFTGLAEISFSERFKLIDLDNAIFEYTGNEPFEGSLSFVLSGLSSGSGSVFAFKFFLSTDGGSSFGQFVDEIEAVVELKTSVTGTSLIIPVVLDKGDQFKLRVQNTGGTENITVENISLYFE